MNKDSKIYIAGHAGLVGSAIHRKLISEGYTNIIFRTSGELDLRDQYKTIEFFSTEKPEYVFLAAAKVGGVKALQTYKADTLFNNLAIQTSVIHAAYQFKVKKLLFLGSNCLYPKLCAQPIKEEYLMAGKLEPSTEYYAVAKIAGIRMCQAYRDQYGCDFITLLPVNLYGPNDNYDLETAHVLPAMMQKFHLAKINNSPSVQIWGSGHARREFMHSDDVADSCLYAMLNYSDSEPVNIGTGSDISIQGLAFLIRDITEYKGEIVFDTSMPQGISGKLLDISKITSLGWLPKIALREGITKTYNELYNNNLSL